jgi:hypothetical protein
MTDIPEGLLHYRKELRDAVDRDLRRHARRTRIAIPTAVLTAAAVAAVLGLTLTAASTPSAYAAAKQALARAGAASSGTMTLGGGFGEITTEWNDGNIALTGGKVLGPLQGLRIVDGGVYVQESDGTWLHYADADNVPRVVAVKVRMARNDVAGNSAEQVLSLATGIEQTAQPDGSTVYTGTIPAITVDPDTLLTPFDDLLMWAILSHRLGDPGDPAMQLRMVAGSDGTVQEVDLARGGDNLKLTYGDLGSTPPIAAPASSTDIAPDALPPGFTLGEQVRTATK